MVHLAEALRESVEMLNAFPPDAIIAFDAPTKYMCLNRLWYQAAWARLEHTVGVRYGEHGRQRYFSFGDRLLVRHKHFDGNLLSSNYPTDHSRDWVSQGYLLGLPPVGRLHFGYRLDLTGTVIKDAFVTLPYGNANLWIWEVWGERVDTFAVPMPLFGKPQVLFAHDDYSKAA